MTITRCRSLVGGLTVGAVLLLAASASAQSPTFTVDPVAYLSVSPSVNLAPLVVVTGTLSCEESDTPVVAISLVQRVEGRNSVEDGDIVTFSCSAGTWAIGLREGEFGFEEPTFKPGKALVRAGLILNTGLAQLVEVEIVVLPPNAARELVEQMSSKTETSTDALQ